MAFPLTEWTEISRATLHGEAGGHAALASLYERYREPVLSFIRASGIAPDAVEDEAQSFFLHLMESRALHRAERTRGKFRTFLLTVLRHFLVDRVRHDMAAKRGGGHAPTWLDAAALDLPDPAANDAMRAPEFDREWAISVMQHALDQVAAEITSVHGAETWEVLKYFFTTTAARPAGRTAAAALDIDEGALKKRVHHWRRRLGECVRAEIRRTVSAPHEVEEEVNYLRHLLTGG